MTNIFKEYSKLNDVFENLDKTTTRSVINAFNKTSLSVDELSDKFGGLDVSTKEYLSTSKRGEASMSGLKSNIDNSATSMGFATIKAKALSIALNALTGLAITLAVKGIVWAFDELVTTLNEQKEKLEDSISAYEDSKTELESINDELKTTSDRIDELNGKDNLTFTEQDELDKLVKTNDELERKIYLLEQANKEAEKDVANEAQNTYKKFTNDRTIGAVDQIDFYTNSSLLEGVNWDNHKDDLSWLVAQYQKQQEVLNNAQENGWANIEEQAKSNITLLEGYMSDASLSYQDLYDTISDISDVSMTPELESAKTDLDDILDIVAEILGYSGQRAETSFDDIWDSKDFEKQKNDLLVLAKSGELTPETLTSNKEYQKLLDETGKTAEETAEHINAIASAEEAVKNAAGEVSFDELSTNAEDATKSVSSLVSEVNSLSQAMSEQSENGELAISTILSLTEAGYATALQFDAATGACTLNADAMKVLIQRKIENQIQDLKTLQTDIATKLKNDGITATESAKGFLVLANAKAASTEVNTSVGDYNEATAQINALQNTIKNLSKVAAGTWTSSAKSASAASKSAKNATEEAAQAMKEIVEKQLALFKAELDSGLIDFKTYVDKCVSYLDDAYKSGKITGSDYWANIKTVYENQLDVYKKVLSAVTRRYDKEISSIEEVIDGIEKQNDALEEQKDKYDSALSAINSLIDAKKEEIQSSIDALEKENDSIEEQISKYESLISVAGQVYDDEISSLTEQQEEIQKKIDALNDEADAYDFIKRKEEALFALERAQNQRTKKVMVNGVFVYQSDTSAIKEAQNNLQDIGKEEVISSLEKEQDKLQESIDILNEYKSKWEEISDAYEREVNKQIAIGLLGQEYQSKILENNSSDITKYTELYLSANAKIDDNTKMISSYNEKITYYDKLSEKWGEVASLKEKAENKQMAVELLGADWEKNILDDRDVTFTDFSNKYLAIQDKINDNQGLINSYNEKITYYEGLKSQWSAIADKYDESVEDQYAAMILGKGYEKDILNGRIETLTTFQNDYIAIQQAIADASWNSANEQIKAAKEAQKAAEGAASGSSSVAVQQDKYKVVDTSTGKDLIKGFTSKKSADRWVHNADDAVYDLDKLEVVKYAKGGMIQTKKSTELDSIAHSIGEDHIVTMGIQEGERILTPVQNSYWERWTNAIPDLISRIQPLNSFNAPDYSNLVTRNITNNAPIESHITFNCPNVTDKAVCDYVMTELENEFNKLGAKAQQRYSKVGK